MPVSMVPPRPEDRGRMAELNRLIAAGMGDVIQPPRRQELARRVGEAIHQQRTPPAVAPPAVQSQEIIVRHRWDPIPDSGGPFVIARLLEIAYSRPCFICSMGGPCGHREPDVELALMRANHPERSEVVR